MVGICRAALVGCTALLLGACSSDRLYGAVRSYQMLKCYRYQDLQQRDQCLQDAVTSYERYQREARQLKPADE